MDTHLLFQDEKVLLLRPALACVLAFAGLTPGDRQALWAQQLNHWLQYHRKAGHRQKHYHDGRWWVWNTVQGWHAQFPFWSKATMERVIWRSIEAGVTLADNYNPARYDRTLWYTIDYERLDVMAGDWERSRPFTQIEEMDSLNLPSSISANCGNRDPQNEEMDSLNLREPIPEIPIDSLEKERQSAWSLACRELEMQMTQATFAAWIGPLKLVQVTGQNGARRAVIHCPNAYVHDWCENRLGARIAAALAGVLDVPPAALEVQYVVEQGADLPGSFAPFQEGPR